LTLFLFFVAEITSVISAAFVCIIQKVVKSVSLCEIDKLKENAEKGEIQQEFLQNSAQSYLGLLSHAKSEKIYSQIERIFWD